MDRVSINLLPKDIITTEQDKGRQKSLVKASIAVLIVMIIITSSILALRIVQNSQLSISNQQFEESKQKVTSYEQTEGLISLLKQRLDNIGTLLSQDSKQATAYNLISSITPAGINILDLSVNKDGAAVISSQSSDVDTLKVFFDNLTDPSKSQGKIGKINIDSITRLSNGQYRVDLTINLL